MFDLLGNSAEPRASGDLVVLGDARRQRPIVGRSVLHRALARLVTSPPRDDCEVLLLVDRDSPTYLEYLQGCCDILGAGNRAMACAAPIWMARLLFREFRKGPSLSLRTAVRAISTIRQRCIHQRYDPSWTEMRLAMPLTTRWKEELVQQEVF